MTKNTKLAITALFAIGLVISFILGRFSAPSGTLNKSISILSASKVADEVEIRTESEGVQIRASSRGTKYYFPWCPSSFAEENTIYFSSVEEAKGAGYEQASDCISDQE
jgi:hypothetical protein